MHGRRCVAHAIPRLLHKPVEAHHSELAPAGQYGFHSADGSWMTCLKFALPWALTETDDRDVLQMDRRVEAGHQRAPVAVTADPRIVWPYDDVGEVNWRTCLL